LGCGRKNYDGTGGNNHAREHSTESGHTLVVKLGTITPDGNACRNISFLFSIHFLFMLKTFLLFFEIFFLYCLAVHCYGCDEEVQDENLAEHLANFGINIAKLQKTEKTITELVCFFFINNNFL